jgi:hypothetical protein
MTKIKKTDSVPIHQDNTKKSDSGPINKKKTQTQSVEKIAQTAINNLANFVSANKNQKD